MQHWCEQKEVLAIYDGYFEPRVSALFELQRRIKSAEAATENEYTGFVSHMRLVGKTAGCLQKLLGLKAAERGRTPKRKRELSARNSSTLVHCAPA